MAKLPDARSQKRMTEDQTRDAIWEAEKLRIDDEALLTANPGYRRLSVFRREGDT